MKVHEMIAALQAMPPDADMGVIWDGAARSSCDLVWLARGGRVLIADYAGPVYASEERPAWAPSVEQERYWSPSDPEAVEEVEPSTYQRPGLPDALWLNLAESREASDKKS